MDSKYISREEKNGITKSYLKYLFDYREGRLYWKESRQGVKPGVEAGSLRPDDYRHILINGELYFTHRLIFLMHKGYLPEFIDHRKGKSNNIENLRECTASENSINRKIPKNNTSGIKNVCPTYNGKYRTYIKCKGVKALQDIFLTEEDAIKAVKEYREKYHGEFANYSDLERQK